MSDSAAGNMARDSLMLEAFAEPEAARLRFYGWSSPAWTFGYSQQWEQARAIAGENGELVRRATGGGLVDHRDDWTYALVLPPAHALSQASAGESYRVIHEALAAALEAAGCRVRLAECKMACADGIQLPGPSQCFVNAERYDLVRADDGRKIAGAAQKRTKRGLLLQGSLSRAAAQDVKDWKKAADAFTESLGGTLGVAPENFATPPWPPETLAEAAAKFASFEWNQRR